MLFRKKYTPTSDLYFRFSIDKYNRSLRNNTAKAVNSNNSSIKHLNYNCIFPNLFETENFLILIRTLDEKSYRYLHKSTKKLIYIVDDNFEEIIKSNKIIGFYRNRVKEFYEKYHKYIKSRADHVVCCSEEIAKHYSNIPATILNPYWKLSSQHLNTSTSQQINNIAWLGTRSHLSDLESIVDSIRPIFIENKKMRFHVFLRKEHIPGCLKGFPGLVLHKPINWEKYYKKIYNSIFDICLYPLEQNNVNESRSINKIVEHYYAGVIGIYPEWFIKHKRIDLSNKLTVLHNDSWVNKIFELLNKEYYTEAYTQHNKTAAKLNQDAYNRQISFWINVLYF